MKKLLLLLPLLSFCIRNYSFENEIKLESAVIKIADGSLINADKIEFMRIFRLKIIECILGVRQSDGQRKGKYKLLGTYHGIQSLARIEQDFHNCQDKQDIITQSMLDDLLIQAKADFVAQSNDFIEIGRGSKNILTILIQEDCQKRNRPNSLLLEWAKTKEGHEATMFESRITSFEEYYHFCTDLVNFLLDLIHSCPKAELQFKERVAKWSAVKTILPTVLKKAHIKIESINEIEFLKFIKERYLDHMNLEEITPQTITPLLTEYIKHTKNHA